MLRRHGSGEDFLGCCPASGWQVEQVGISEEVSPAESDEWNFTLFDIAAQSPLVCTKDARGFLESLVGGRLIGHSDS